MTWTTRSAGFEVGADDYLTKPFELRELIVRLRALARRPTGSTPTVIEYAGVRLDPFRREVYRWRSLREADPQAVLRAGGADDRTGGVISAETLLETAWDENADPFSNAVRITISAVRKRLGDPWVIHTVPGVGYRIGS